MRAGLTTLLMLLAAVLSGCLDTDPERLTGADAGPEAGADAADLERNRAFLEDHPQFCDSEDACKFWDDDYHQYVVYDLDTTVIDVVIVPPAPGASPLDELAASRLAAQAWSDGIEALGQSWFTDNFAMNVYAVGVDVPSLDAVQDPEIIVLSTAAVPDRYVGIGLEPKQFGCILLGEETLYEYPVHAHGDVEVRASDCTGIGFTCFAINAGRLSDVRALYDLIAHEIGHCLGVGHVGDAGDFRARYAPVEDIMSYQGNPEQVHCVSNLNVRTLEGVYAHLLDRPTEEHLPRGSYLPMAPWDYAQVECENPPGM